MEQNLFKLRSVLQSNKLDGFIFSNSDEFNNEYVPQHNERIKFLTGFTGSRALCIILHNKAAIFVDGRYTLQAKQQIDANYFDVLDYSNEQISAFISNNIPKNANIAINTCITSLLEFNFFKTLCNKNSVNLVSITKHLVDEIWLNRPSFAPKPITEHTINYSGLSTSDKIALVSNKLKNLKLGGFFISDLASICWLLNIRGNDISYNPYPLSYLYITQDGKVILFCNLSSVSKYLQQSLFLVEIVDINTIEYYFTNLKAPQNNAIGIDNECLQYFYDLFIKCNFTVNVVDNPINMLKAQKNVIEISNIKQAHIYDGVALIKLLYLLDKSPSSYSELAIEQQLISIKKELYNKEYTEESFAAIIGINSNAAIVHYKATPKTNKNLTENDYLLIDSGSQYLLGTTDVTRSLSFKYTASDYKTHYTLVLKGLIALSNCVFPQGTTGGSLDILARQFLWQYGFNYNHGTGHGVGMFSGVHEFSVFLGVQSQSIVYPNMVFSIEPGLYIENKYGIRLENLVVVKEHNNKGYLYLECLTLVPFDCKNINVDLLTIDEINYINNYHTLVKEKIASSLSKDEKNWLNTYTILSAK